MRICSVEVRNFRGIEFGSIVLPQHAVLMGANNAGKSTIVEALALLFARERMVDALSDWDFFGGRPNPASRFYVIATLVDFPGNSMESSPDWFIGEGRARPCWWHEGTSKLHLDVDPPPETLLATQVAIAGRYDEETCSFEVQRYFYYGESDPFTENCAAISQGLLKQVGFFLLASNREWDRLLSFSSSSLMKVLRENEAIPGKVIEALKEQLRNCVERVEEAQPLASIVEAAERELRSFSLIHGDSRIAYRPTALDTLSVLRSLNAHIVQSSGTLLPVARHGAGLVALQAFLLLLAFAERRLKDGRNFVLAAEEPELHLHPSLHQRLVNRVRGSSTQSIVTTQSPHVAASYQPTDVVFVRNEGGQLSGTPLRSEPIVSIPMNSVRNLYRRFRHAYYEALMGGVLLIPEGITDYEWLLLFQRLAQSTPDVSSRFEIAPISVVPTSDAAVAETFQELARFRSDAIPILDGDADGAGYAQRLRKGHPSPCRILRLGPGAAMECLAAWILEPSLPAPGPALNDIGCRQCSLAELQNALIDRKHDRDLRAAIMWEAIDTPGCHERVCEFLHDVSALAAGRQPRNARWVCDGDSQAPAYTASHIAKA